MKRRGLLSLMGAWARLAVFSAAIFALLMAADCKDDAAKPPNPDIYKGVKNVFVGANASNEKKEEHGNLDFFGRDIIRGISSTASKVSKKLGFDSSNSSRGLDANKTFFSGVGDSFKKHVAAIYPGTLWCGGGNKAKSYDDLGYFNDTDACCRDHDECPENMDAGATKHGLMNTGLFTRSHCDCDKKFYDCLKSADSIVSKKIGFTYFTVLGPQCYKLEDEIVDCRKEEMGRCVEYKTKTSEQKFYQWIDNPVF